MRTIGCCVGAARCEKACLDSMEITRDLTLHYQNEIHRPAFPYKFKIKVSACANDCAAASARSDLAIIGTWRDILKIDQQAVAEYVDGGFDIVEQVVRKCPTEALAWDAGKKELKVKAEECVRCMHCINAMHKALHIGQDRGATLLIGGKAPVVKGAMIGWVLVPFIKMEPPFTELKEIIDRLIDWWAENGKHRERIGELIERVGLATFLKAVGLKPLPQMVRTPRSNPYIFWNKEEVTTNG
jgi:dissimilatory sulfite reductase alpha subunit